MHPTRVCELTVYALNCRAIDSPATCAECLYYNAEWCCCNTKYIMKDALTLLKEQEARVLSAEEIRSGEAVVMWLEDKDRENVIPGLWFRLSNEGGDEAVDIHVMDGFIGARLAEYNKRWRAWTAHPSDEQRKEAAWNG